MRYLLDTNVVSEPRKSKPSTLLMTWLSDVSSEDIVISVVTVGEIRAGIEAQRDRHAAATGALEQWLADLLDGLGASVLPVDNAVADRWGRLHHALRESPIAVADELIAATALVHDATVATRNIRHFERTGTRVFNPFGD